MPLTPVAPGGPPKPPPSSSCIVGLLPGAPPARWGVLGELWREGARRPKQHDRPAAEAVGDGPEGRARAREAGEEAPDVLGRELAHRRPVGEPPGEPVDVRALAWPEAAVAAPAHARTDRAAARLRDRAEARLAAGDHDALEPPALALEAHGLVGQLRPAAGRHGR